MLRGAEHRGVRLSTTSTTKQYTPIHRGFERSGCMNSLRRIVQRLLHDPMLARFVAKLPKWLLDECFRSACSSATIRDADEYRRRFGRLRRLLQTGTAHDVTLRRARRVRRPHRVWCRPRVRYLGVRVAHLRRYGDALGSPFDQTAFVALPRFVHGVFVHRRAREFHDKRP